MISALLAIWIMRLYEQYLFEQVKNSNQWQFLAKWYHANKREVLKWDLSLTSGQT